MRTNFTNVVLCVAALVGVVIAPGAAWAQAAGAPAGGAATAPLVGVDQNMADGGVPTVAGASAPAGRSLDAILATPANLRTPEDVAALEQEGRRLWAEEVQRREAQARADPAHPPSEPAHLTAWAGGPPVVLADGPARVRYSRATGLHVERPTIQVELVGNRPEFHLCRGLLREAEALERRLLHLQGLGGIVELPPELADPPRVDPSRLSDAQLRERARQRRELEQRREAWEQAERVRTARQHTLVGYTLRACTAQAEEEARQLLQARSAAASGAAGQRPRPRVRPRAR